MTLAQLPTKSGMAGCIFGLYVPMKRLKHNTAWPISQLPVWHNLIARTRHAIAFLCAKCKAFRRAASTDTGLLA